MLVTDPVAKPFCLVLPFYFHQGFHVTPGHHPLPLRLLSLLISKRKCQEVRRSHFCPSLGPPFPKHCGRCAVTPVHQPARRLILCPPLRNNVKKRGLIVTCLLQVV